MELGIYKTFSACKRNDIQQFVRRRMASQAGKYYEMPEIVNPCRLIVLIFAKVQTGWR